MRIYEQNPTLMIYEHRATRRSFSREFKKILGLLPFGDIHRHTKKPVWDTFGIADTPRPSSDPADGSIRQHNAILSFVAAVSPYRFPRDPIASCSVVRVHTFLELAVANLPLCRELKELTNFVGDPESVGGGIEFPRTEMGSFGGEGDAFLEFV